MNRLDETWAVKKYLTIVFQTSQVSIFIQIYLKITEDNLLAVKAIVFPLTFI